MLEGENKIIKHAQRGSSEYFGQLYDHYAPQIYRFIFLKVSHQETAEDLMHEVFLNAWKNIDNYNYRGFPFSSWLYQIARNRVIDHYRTRKEATSLENLQESATEWETETESDIEDKLDISYDMEKIKVALRQLSEAQQNVLILRFIEELSPAEIAPVIGKSEGAVRLIQHRAINNLRTILNSQSNTSTSSVDNSS